ncbi:MAG TPA: hypothetical protein VKA48_07405 [Gammaproteobacteria bacterium]|nr:hypothetical protein [Gammaproteobacteria bacterium]
MARTGRWTSGLLLLALLAACGGPRYIAQPAPDNLPAEWRSVVTRANGETWTVLGFGKAQEQEDSPLAGRDRAASRARADLDTRVQARLDFLRGKLAETLVPKKGNGLGRADLQAILKRAGDIAVNQSRIIRRQRSSGGVWQALARTELKNGLQEAARRQGLPEPTFQQLLDQSEAVLGTPQKSGKGDDGGEGSD